MGLRLKILVVFLVSFGVLAGLSLHLLQRNMEESYATLEHRQLTNDMHRVQQAVTARLDATNNMLRDWTEWTDMYRYAQKPNASWADNNIGTDALAAADLSLFVVFGRNQNVLTTMTSDAQGRPMSLRNFLASPYAAHLKQANLKPGCGLLPTDAGLMLSCWSRIARSDGTGDFVGNAVMGRLLDAALVDKFRRQESLPLEFHPDITLPPNLSRWPGQESNSHFKNTDFFTTHVPEVYRLYFPLADVLGQHAGFFKINLPRELHLQGKQVFKRMSQELLWAVAGMAVLLFSVLQFLLIGRLRQFDHELVALASDAKWEKRLTISGTDELGVLAGRVNQLLSLIQSQVTTLNELSLTDALTGLANRRAFDTRLAQEHARALRHGKGLALLLVDVDLFKAYNDFYGHPMGDLALKKIANVLQQSVRQTPDFAARIGGEEFALLLPETDLAGAQHTAERIHANLRAMGIAHAASSVGTCMTLSLGIAIVKDETAESLVKRADLALYQAKESGRNRTQLAA